MARVTKGAGEPQDCVKVQAAFQQNFFCLQTMLIQACHCPRQVIWSDLNCLHSILFLTALTPNDQQVLMKKIRTLDLSVQELTLLAPIDHHYSSIPPCIELGQRLSHRTVPYERNRGTTKKEVFVRFKNKNGREKKNSSDQISRSWKKNNWNGIASIFVSKKKKLFFHSDDFFYFRWNFRPWSTWTTASRWPRPTPSAATSTAWPSSPRTGSISSKELAEKRLGN